MFVAVHGSSSMLPRSFKSKVMDPQVWKVRLLSSIGTHTKLHWKAHCRLLLGDYQPFVNAKLGCHHRVKKGPVDSSLEQFLQYVGRLMLNAFEWSEWSEGVLFGSMCVFSTYLLPLKSALVLKERLILPTELHCIGFLLSPLEVSMQLMVPKSGTAWQNPSMAHIMLWEWCVW